MGRILGFNLSSLWMGVSYRVLRTWTVTGITWRGQGLLGCPICRGQDPLGYLLLESTESARLSSLRESGCFGYLGVVERGA